MIALKSNVRSLDGGGDGDGAENGELMRDFCAGFVLKLFGLNVAIPIAGSGSVRPGSCTDS